MRNKLSHIGIVVALVASFGASLSAEVVRIDVQSRGDIAGGESFGAAGPFEKITGRIYFAVDPALPANRIITDIDKAPRNAAGKVEFSSDFFLIKPKRIERGNGAVLYEVSNRGGKGMLGFFDHASGSADPTTAEQMGDGFADSVVGSFGDAAATFGDETGSRFAAGAARATCSDGASILASPPAGTATATRSTLPSLRVNTSSS